VLFENSRGQLQTFKILSAFFNSKIQEQKKPKAEKYQGQMSQFGMSLISITLKNAGVQVVYRLTSQWFPTVSQSLLLSQNSISFQHSS